MDNSFCKGSRCRYVKHPIERFKIDLILQALEGKNVKDMLLNVGSGGGAAAAPSGGAGGATAADTPAEEVKEEKKEEGKSCRINNVFLMPLCFHILTRVASQKRRIQTRIWASVSSTELCGSIFLLSLGMFTWANHWYGDEHSWRGLWYSVVTSMEPKSEILSLKDRS